MESVDSLPSPLRPQPASPEGLVPSPRSSPSPILASGIELKILTLLNRVHLHVQHDRISDAAELCGQALHLSTLLPDHILGTRCWYWKGFIAHRLHRCEEVAQAFVKAMPRVKECREGSRFPSLARQYHDPMVLFIKLGATDVARQLEQLEELTSEAAKSDRENTLYDQLWQEITGTPFRDSPSGPLTCTPLAAGSGGPSGLHSQPTATSPKGISMVKMGTEMPKDEVDLLMERLINTQRPRPRLGRESSRTLKTGGSVGKAEI